MKQVKLLATAFFAGVIILAGCKKETTTPPAGGGNTNKTAAEILMANSWIVTDIRLDGASLWPLVDDCEKDNFSTFKANNVLTFDEGAVKCDPADPQTSNDVWKLLESDTKIVYGADTMKILELTSSKGRFSQTTQSGELELRIAPKP